MSSRKGWRAIMVSLVFLTVTALSATVAHADTSELSWLGCVDSPMWAYGDTDMDLDVDINDYALLAFFFDTVIDSETISQAVCVDFDKNLRVDVNDAAVIAYNFGLGGSSA